MKNSIFTLSVLAFVLLTNAYGQKPAIELSFTASYYGQSVQLDSMLIENLTQGGDMMLYAPITSLVLDYETGETENSAFDLSSFSVSTNFPNPFATKTEFSIYLPKEDFVQVMIFNSLGQKIASYENKLENGNHSFTFYPGDEQYYFMTAIVDGVTKSIKMISLSNYPDNHIRLIYSGKDNSMAAYKSLADIKDLIFSLGDELRFITYAKTPDQINGSDIIIDAPLCSQDYTFNILEGIPCSGTPSVTYEEQMYKTVQVGSQCWLKENLNVGTMIDGSNEQTNNSLIEKYCYHDSIENCNTYGGLYQWGEMMDYTTLEGSQGICPDGWHIPTDEERETLSEFLGGINIAGGKMKEIGTLHWLPPNTGATNESGFTGFSGGFRDETGGFSTMGLIGLFWSSTQINTNGAKTWGLSYINTSLLFGYGTKNTGNSLRCLKD
jgi:uncharacterized protein (TIGR02145 family)